MAVTRRQQILDAIVARLKTITVANEYDADFDQSVYLDLRVPQKGETACLCVSDQTADANFEVVNSRTDYDLDVVIDVIVHKDPTGNLQRAYAGDVLKAIGTDPTFGALVRRTELKSVDTNIQYNQGHLSGAEIALAMTYRMPSWEI